MKRGSSAQMIEFAPSFAYRGTEGQSETYAVAESSGESMHVRWFRN